MENNTKKFSPRYQSRELSLKVLFSYTQNPRTSIEENFSYMKENFFPKLKKTELAEQILEQFQKNEDEIKSVIIEFANKWDMEKQNPIDITILELLTTEVLFLDTPAKVAISEYLNLVSDYSKDNSYSFVN
jgi:transcription antitermination factor NusB